MSSVQYESSILEEECTFHKQVEWVIKRHQNGIYEKQPLKATSPEFKIGSQCYKLELSSDSFRWVNLFLHRRGPSIDGPSCFVQWWAGLKCMDGTYNDRNLKGELELKEKCQTWRRIILHRISFYELDDYVQHSMSRDIFVVFFRLSLEQALVTTEECTHGAAKMSAQGSGTIREEECTSHKYVEWEVEFDRLRKRGNLTSPSFMIETRSYKLELTFGREKTIHLHLCSKEPPDPSRSSRWWAGMKRRDGACLRGSNGRGTLDLKKECELWTQKNLYTLKEDELKILANDQKQHLFVFFRLSFERASTVAEMCDHVPVMMSFPGSNGTVREEERSSYKHVEWEISMEGCSIYKRSVLISPEFAIGSQYHKLEFCICYPNHQLNLYSRGPSVNSSRTARWWAGFRRSDETCLLAITSGIMDLQEFCELWTQKCLYSVCKEVEEAGGEIKGPFTFFFRMQQATTAEETWADGTTEMSAAQGEGSIKEVECASHKEVEWDPSFKHLNLFRGVWSPAFAIGTQQFKFQMYLASPKISMMPVCIRLYSRGPSVVGPCRSLHWCIGSKCDDGTYIHKMFRGELDLKEACELWTLRGFVDFTFSDYGSMDRTFFFWLKKESSPMATNACIHGVDESLTDTEGYGMIRRQDFPSHEQVEWTVDYDRLNCKDENFSPEFSIGTQRYIIELAQDSNTSDSMILCLYRRGSSVAEPSRFVRWWAGIKRGKGTYHYRNQRGRLDLNEECVLWTRIHLHRVCRYELERELLAPNNSLVVFFRLSMERTATTCTHDGVEAVEKIKQRRNEDNDVVFKVEDMKFRMPRAILKARTPVFKVMFHQDTVENTTGVVTIKDFKPAIVEEFLHYITAGFLRELTVHNAFAFYAIADKYMADDFKAECLQCLSDTLSVDSFCDVVTLALRHREDDLMKEATDFFSRNKNITTTDSWKKFCADNPAEAVDLLLKVSPPEEKKERKVNKKKQKVKKKKQKGKKSR